MVTPSAPIATIVPITSFRRDLGRALQRRGQALLEADDMEEQMQSLAPLEAYFVVKELGLESAAPLLMAASDAQLHLCLDLDCWHDGLLDPVELDAWLATFVAVDPTQLAGVFMRLDEEVQILFLTARLLVLEITAPEDGIAEDMPSMATPDDAYRVFERQADGAEINALQLVEGLYRVDPRHIGRMLMAVLSELQSPLEEQALQFRAGRLEDAGFPDRSRALQILAPPPAEPPLMLTSRGHHSSPLGLPALYAETLTQASLLAQALAVQTDASTVARIEQELVYLMNAAVVAYGEDPRDLRQVRAIATRVHDTLNLGLQDLLAQGPVVADVIGVAAASQLLQRWPLLHVLQTGHQLLQPLRRAAAQLAQDPAVASWLATASEPDEDPSYDDRAFVRGLCRQPPVLAEALPLNPDAIRAFAGHSEVQAALARLDALAAAR